MSKVAFIYKASTVYPFVNCIQDKLMCTISNNELCEIIAYVEHYELISAL